MSFVAAHRFMHFHLTMGYFVCGWATQKNTWSHGCEVIQNEFVLQKIEDQMKPEDINERRALLGKQLKSVSVQVKY